MKTKPKILVIDDEVMICKSCVKILAPEGYVVETISNPKKGLEKALSGDYDIVITDIKMPELSGTDILRIIKEKSQWTIVIVITGYSSVPSAVAAIKDGAFNYIPKPFTPDELLSVVQRALEQRGYLEEHSHLGYMNNGNGKHDTMVGKSKVMNHLNGLISIVSPTDSTVLIYGESGTGKELVAHAIHTRSPRTKGKFVAVDCSALTDTLFESEIFGHDKGAFTGAFKNKTGLLEEAAGGTLFLDEVSNISLAIQAKLLRVLEEKSVKHVGGTEMKETDFRLVCATNKDLADLVAEGTFREDLYYRINVFPINLPPLRNRAEDIPDIAFYFLKRFAAETGKNIAFIDPGAIDLLTCYDWPGNIRELRNLIEQLVILTVGDTIKRNLVASILGTGLTGNKEHTPENNEELKEAKKEARELAVDKIEKAFILAALKKADWNVTQAAHDTGMQRQNFQALVRKFKILPEDQS